MNLFEKVLGCFVNNIAMGQGLFQIGSLEAKGEGIQFSNWMNGVSIDDELSFFNILTMMFFNNFIYMLITYYIDNIIPGEHGIRKPWHYTV